MIATEGISYEYADLIANISGKWTASGSNSGEQKCAEGATLKRGISQVSDRGQWHKVLLSSF